MHANYRSIVFVVVDWMTKLLTDEIIDVIECAGGAI